MTGLFSKAWLFAMLLVLVPTGYADVLELRDGSQIRGTYEGGDGRVLRFRTDQGIRDYDVLDISRVVIGPQARLDRSAAEGDLFPDHVSIVFGRDEERIIRDWFADPRNMRGLPPGLARRESLPPGLARQVRRNGTLPPGLERRVEPLPRALEIRLPRLVVGIERVILGRDVLLVDARTGTILDVLSRVF